MNTAMSVYEAESGVAPNNNSNNNNKSEISRELLYSICLRKNKGVKIRRTKLVMSAKDEEELIIHEYN